MSKKLPKTSNQTLDDLRKAARSALDSELPQIRSVASPARESTVGKPDIPARDTATAKMQVPEDPAKAPPESGPEPGTASQPKPNLAVAKPPRHDKAVFLEASGRLIIERHANFAGIAGLVPMPWVDMAAIAVIAERMLRKLSRLYGQPLPQDQGKRLVLAMLVGMTAPGVAGFATTGLLRMTPGPHLLGMAITSVSAIVLIRIIGDVYLTQLKMEHTAASA
jgi:uncharacterized protein (DUF697 family)